MTNLQLLLRAWVGIFWINHGSFFLAKYSGFLPKKSHTLRYGMNGNEAAYLPLTSDGSIPKKALNDFVK